MTETKVGQFIAFDVQKRAWEIYVYQQRHEQDDRNGGTHIVDGLKRLETAEGCAVRRVEKGVYDVLRINGDLRVTSSDKDAA